MSTEKTTEPIERAVEIEEDGIWNAIAEERLMNVEKWLSHSEVWK